MDDMRRKYALGNPFSDNSTFIEAESRYEGSTDYTLDEEDNLVDNLELQTDIELPIFQYREEIAKQIRENKCVVLTGSTGCGKTTQVPKIVVEDCLRRSEPFNILVSQPRKIAAITNSNRVAQEMNRPLGTLVGFQVSLHRALNKVGEKTKVLYCTTGVILQKLIKTKTMKMYSHIILDEIHERDIEMDFLLILIRQYLQTNSKNTKIILMSATLDSEHFAKYFRTESTAVPIIRMQVKRNFSIEKKFLDQLDTGFSNGIIDFEKPAISEELMQVAADIVFNHVQKDHESSILVFLPGFYEIENFEKALLFKFDVLQNFQIIILHSALTPDDQKMAFKADDKPKIILSTNIAENSVTIPKVNVVIDFCLTKYLVASKDSNLASLQLNWTSRTSSTQRAGRTGRVCDGIVYHLVPKKFYEDEMPKFSDPEMKRVPLERVILKTKLITLGSPESFLREALDPPHINNIRNSILILKELGAIQHYNSMGEFQEDDGELTFCGRVMASLPCDIYIGKFIVLGYIFSVLEEAVIIGAGLNINGSIFKFDHRDQLVSYSHRLNWSNGSGSDLIAILNAYKLWRNNKREGNFRTPDSEMNWCTTNSLNRKNLCEMKELIVESMHRLEEHRIKLIEGDRFEPIHLEKEKVLMIKMCIAGAWLPFYFLQEQPAESSERVAYREIDSKNVHRTVFFRDTEQKYTTLYNDILKRDLVRHGICGKVDDIDITYKQGASKILVTFTREETMENVRDDRGIRLIDGMVLPEVYVAVKNKELSHSSWKMHVMDHPEIKKFAKKVGYTRHRDAQSLINLSTASSSTLGLDEMTGMITHVEHCGKFFFKPTGSSYDPSDRLMHFKLRIQKLAQIKNEMELTNGDKVVIRYKEQMHRGIVVKPSNERIKYKFIDLGLITSDIELDDVHHCPKSLHAQFEEPPRCFECKLSELAPSFLKSDKGFWTIECVEYFRSLAEGKKAKIEIFSVVDEVVSVTLLVDGMNINQLMIESEHAVKSDEDYNSRMNYEERRSEKDLSFISTTPSVAAPTCFSVVEKKEKKNRPLLPPSGMSNMRLTLSGPHSPLESQLFGVLGVENLSIKIDPQSVNSVILNGDINGFSSRLYVAANITKNRFDGITLRETTMFPKIPGLAETIAMIFCPKMVLRRNEDNTRHVMLQTGLGCDLMTNQPFFPSHDAIFPVTVRFNDEDFTTINRLRGCMSHLLYTAPNVDFPNWTEDEKYELQKKIKHLIPRILITDRDILGIPTQGLVHSWEPEGDLVHRTDPLGSRALYGFHAYPKLCEVSPKKTEELKKNLITLEKIANSGNGSGPANIVCQLCKLTFNNKKEIADHLLTPLHRKMTKQIGNCSMNSTRNFEE